MPDNNGNTGTIAAQSADLQQKLEDAMDKFGRTAFERTVELEVDDAERVDTEVTTGEHATFSDGLHYIIERGVAEIKRQRDSLAALKEQRNDASMMKALRTACANNPDLMTNPVKLADVMKSLGIKLSTTTK
jgi:hypothetical protein